MLKTLFAVAGAFAMAAIPRLVLAQDNLTPGGEPQPPPPPSMMAPPPSMMAPPPPSSTEPPPAALCPPGTTPLYETQAPVETPRHRAAYSRYQQSLTVGGGATDFVRDRISDRTNVGGTWDLRYTVGTRTFVGFEAGYTGTAQGVSDAVALTPSNIVTTQVAGSVRFNLTRSRFQPFATAGAGWVNLHRSGEGDITEVSINDSTNSFVAPFGAGFAGYIGQHAVIDARGNYNLITNKDFATGGARPDMWNAELRFGYAF